MKKSPSLKANDEKTRILLVDDHPIVREGVARRINRQTDMEVCGEADDAPGVLDAVEKLHPNLAIVDLSLRSSSGLELIKDIKARYPELPVLVLSVYDELQYAERTLQAGARGYVMKQDDPAALERAIRQVLRGEVVISERVNRRIVNRVAGLKNTDVHSPLDLFSDRELEVFELLGQGFSTGEIASRLHLSPKTVATHRENLKQKLKLPTTQALLRFAIPWVNQVRPNH